jgi:hypothetical protein
VKFRVAAFLLGCKGLKKFKKQKEGFPPFCRKEKKKWIPQLKKKKKLSLKKKKRKSQQG